MTDQKRPGVQSVVSRKASAVDLVLHEIRRSILSGELPPGQPFTVPALTDQLGVSHVPVREALRQLEAQGLIVLSPSRSAIVTPLDEDDLRSIYRLRIMVEPELAALSAPGRTDRDVDELDRMVRATFGDVLGEAFWAPHREFHAALIEPAASEWDRRMLAPLWDASERYTRLVFDPVDAPDSFATRRAHAHDTLVEAARSRDPDRMRSAVREHLENNVSTMLAAMGHATQPTWDDRDASA
ncbi:GntR family transcriptional regulator [Pseudonocardia endophytica]|uniref:DNA-binding GntR family transcriptional regulator n=1 Tax=Pseudonocardia endophytica TaxID=401976 RepID=A0A4R1HLS2_PSEEN|nr:GntR family transcriptional regulator [Pseudonocardia endophytica]TCK21465.1 DNA-binding GntR family transcriptional regulator [Pseudonocardia endophytica]